MKQNTRVTATENLPPGNNSYHDEVKARLRWARENGVELPLNADGSLDDISLQRLYHNRENKKMTPDEKIASVHIDFSKDNVLPELNERELTQIGAKRNKKILLKKSVIDRNREAHSDLTDSDFETIVSHALYNPSDVFPANKEKPYYHFPKVIEVNSKGKPYLGLALLDVDEKKDNFEIVHAHFVRASSYETMKRKQ